MIIINVLTIFMFTAGHSFISLFLVADLVCATEVLPLFLGMQANDFGPWNIFVAPTKLGDFVGCLRESVSIIGKGDMYIYIFGPARSKRGNLGPCPRPWRGVCPDPPYTATCPI